MNQYKIYVVGREKPFEFCGQYRRDLESAHWHYYEDEDGCVWHFRKDRMDAVHGDTAEDIIESRKCRA